MLRDGRAGEAGWPDLMSSAETFNSVAHSHSGPQDVRAGPAPNGSFPPEHDRNGRRRRVCGEPLPGDGEGGIRILLAARCQRVLPPKKRSDYPGAPRRSRPAEWRYRLFALALGALGVQSLASLTSRAGELRSAPSGPDDRDRVAGMPRWSLDSHPGWHHCRPLLQRPGWAIRGSFFALRKTKRIDTR